jgi:hypothetical protein
MYRFLQSCKSYFRSMRGFLHLIYLIQFGHSNSEVPLLLIPSFSLPKIQRTALLTSTLIHDLPNNISLTCRKGQDMLFKRNVRLTLFYSVTAAFFC